MRPPRTKPKPKLLGGNVPKPLRARVDIDYSEKLSPSERAWLDQFVDEFYSGDFSGSEPGAWSPEQRREAWSHQRASRQDAYGLSGLANGPDEIPLDAESKPLTLEPTPGYLDDPEYKAARDEFREHLTKHRRAAEPIQTPEFLKARRRLSVVTPTAPVVPTPPTPKRTNAAVKPKPAPKVAPRAYARRKPRPS